VNFENYFPLKCDDPLNISELEKQLPLPYYFKKLISRYRQFGKQAKKAADYRQALDCYNRMLSLSIIWHEVYGPKNTGIAGWEVDKAEEYLNGLRKLHSTLYPYTFQGHGPVPNDVLLSDTDYKMLRTLSELVGEESSEVGHTVTSLKQFADASAQDKPEIRFSRERSIAGRRSSAPPKGKSLFVNSSGQDVTVEQLALDYYQKKGYQGLWSENDYWWQVMTLLYWDVIYAKLPEAFTPALGGFPSKMQDIPRDMFKQDFYERRRRLVEQRHKSLTQPKLFGILASSPESEIKKAWNKHRGKACRFFGDWQKFTIEELALAPRILNHEQLIAIMERLLRDFNNHRRGLPDLFLGKDQQPLFVEVKQQHERVSQPQLEWHEFLVTKVGIPTEVCRVVG
jgi:hypothetical protein